MRDNINLLDPNELALAAIFQAWRNITSAYEMYYGIKYQSRKQEALEKLAILRQTYINHGAKALENALGGIKYRSEKVDHAKPPWVMIIEGYGDCEDFCLLLYEIIRGGDIYDFVQLRNGQMQNYKTKWHFVYRDLDNVMWSNGSMTDMDGDDWARRLGSTHIIMMDTEMFIQSVVTP